jgi:hypothetical protein
MHLLVRTAGGQLIAERRANNIVLRQGAEIVAKLFSGQANQPINQIQVGFARESADAETVTLKPSPDGVELQKLRSPIAADKFKVQTDKPGIIRVNIASVFQPTVELKNVSEAGLLAGEQLYNQVVFEPITLQVGQDITFFWDIEFPFGH